MANILCQTKLILQLETHQATKCNQNHRTIKFLDHVFSLTRVRSLSLSPTLCVRTIVCVFLCWLTVYCCCYFRCRCECHCCYLLSITIPSGHFCYVFFIPKHLLLFFNVLARAIRLIKCKKREYLANVNM